MLTDEAVRRFFAVGVLLLSGEFGELPIEIRLGRPIKNANRVQSQSFPQCSCESWGREYDLIFNDVDKEGYPDVYRQPAGRVRRGGFFVTDNTLRRGDVADPAVTNSEIDAVRHFNDLLAGDRRFESVLLPLRDGVTVAFRL